MACTMVSLFPSFRRSSRFSYLGIGLVTGTVGSLYYINLPKECIDIFFSTAQSVTYCTVGYRSHRVFYSPTTPHSMSEPCPRGRPSWVTGQVLKFFTSFSDDWQRACDRGHLEAGKFYDNVTKHFICAFGFDFKRFEDGDAVPAVYDESMWKSIMDHKGLDDAEIDRRREYQTTLRLVSRHIFNVHVFIVLTLLKQIQRWFHHFHNKDTPGDNTAMEIQKLFEDLASPAAPKPRAKQLVHFYSKKFWDLKIKHAVDNQWPAQQQQQLSTSGKKYTRFEFSNKVTEDMWKAEPAEVKAWVKVERDQDTKIRIKEWEDKESEKKKQPDSPESFHT